MNYVSLVISALGLVLSIFVFRRTVLKEKQDLQITILHAYDMTIADQRFIIIKLVAVNRSKLPIVITDSVLKLNVPSYIDPKLSYPEFHGVYEKLELLKLGTVVNGKSTKTEQIYSTPFPMNVDALKSISATIAISTPDYHTELNAGHKPSLVFETTGKPITISNEKLLKSVTSVDQLMKEPYSLP